MGFEDQVIVITGGTRGIGASIAQTFDRLGARLLLIYRSNEKAAINFLNELDGDHQIYQCDISDPEQVEELVDDIHQEFGQIDICINNAGVGFHHPIDEVSYVQWQESWQQIMNVNLIGPSNMSYKVAQVMMSQGSGRIINVSSRGAFRGEPLMPAYGASKAGLNSMTQSLAHALSQHNICLLYTSPSPRDRTRSRMPSSA